MARPICFRLLTHCDRRAASRAACTGGKSKAIRTAMMAMTTSNSIRVKPRRRMEHLAFVGGNWITTHNDERYERGRLVSMLPLLQGGRHRPLDEPAQWNTVD